MPYGLLVDLLLLSSFTAFFSLLPSSQHSQQATRSPTAWTALLDCALLQHQLPSALQVLFDALARPSLPSYKDTSGMLGVSLYVYFFLYKKRSIEEKEKKNKVMPKKTAKVTRKQKQPNALEQMKHRRHLNSWCCTKVCTFWSVHENSEAFCPGGCDAGVWLKSLFGLGKWGGLGLPLKSRYPKKQEGEVNERDGCWRKAPQPALSGSPAFLLFSFTGLQSISLTLALRFLSLHFMLLPLPSYSGL